MDRANHFVIRNDSSRPMVLNIEPEGVCVALSEGEEVSVFDAFTLAPVTIRLTSSERGEPILSVWPGDGEVRVEKEGVDLFEIVENGVTVGS